MEALYIIASGAKQPATIGRVASAVADGVQGVGSSNLLAPTNEIKGLAIGLYGNAALYIIGSDNMWSLRFSFLAEGNVRRAARPGAINPATQEIAMNTPRLPTRRTSTFHIPEAIALKRAFGVGTANRFLRDKGVSPELLEQALDGQHDRRREADRRAAARSA